MVESPMRPSSSSSAVVARTRDSRAIECAGDDRDRRRIWCDDTPCGGDPGRFLCTSTVVHSLTMYDESTDVTRHLKDDLDDTLRVYGTSTRRRSIGRWVDRWVDRSIDRSMGRWVDGSMGRWVDRWVRHIGARARARARARVRGYIGGDIYLRRRYRRCRRYRRRRRPSSGLIWCAIYLTRAIRVVVDDDDDDDDDDVVGRARRGVVDEDVPRWAWRGDDDVWCVVGGWGDVSVGRGRVGGVIGGRGRGWVAPCARRGGFGASRTRRSGLVRGGV